MDRGIPTADRIPALQCTSSDIQIEAVARDIQRTVFEKDQRGMPALSFRDFLILCPTTTQVNNVEQVLKQRFGLPVRTPARLSIPDDLWSVLLILRIAGTDDPLALRQWLPLLGLTNDDILRLRRTAMTSHQPFSQVCYTAADPKIDALRVAIDRVRMALGSVSSLIDALRATPGSQVPTDLEQLLDTVLTAEGKLPRLDAIVHQIYEHFGILEAGELVQEADSILVATLHSAKGLEAEFVYCLWMNSTFMPMAGRDPEEQRRVLYVALTRAKRQVILLYPEEFDPRQRRRLGEEIMSPFLQEISAHLEITRLTAAGVRSDPPAWKS
jgi:ATP-dependent exoDNAse (exonuclease V) beta subunit